MKQIRYNGQEDCVLIDVGSLSNGTIIQVSDTFADQLVSAFPENYEVVDAEEVPTNDTASTPKDAPSTETPSSSTKGSTKSPESSAS